MLYFQVEEMQRELTDLQPVLARTAVEVEEMMVVITNDKKEADETKKQVEQQEKDANEQAAKAKAIAEDAQVRETCMYILVVGMSGKHF